MQVQEAANRGRLQPGGADREGEGKPVEERGQERSARGDDHLLDHRLRAADGDLLAQP